MKSGLSLLSKRRFLPLFATQMLNGFNDNLFKNAMVLIVVYGVYQSEHAETVFSGVASALFILPFILFSAIAGQMADARDKAVIIRLIKLAEIFIMLVGGLGLLMTASAFAVEEIAIPLMLLALFAMGLHSTFFGPIKYAILPQHLEKQEVLAGTGLVEAGTYIAILAGTILAGLISPIAAAIAVICVAVIGFFTARHVPPAPPEKSGIAIDWNIWRSSKDIIRHAMEQRSVWLAIIAISFFWAVGSVLFIQFPPLAKNVLSASKAVASLFLAVFSVGIAIGSVAINQLLRGKVSARFAPVCVLIMAGFVCVFYYVCTLWQGAADGGYYTVSSLMALPLAWPLLLSLLGIAVSGGMFVVPLYAFLTTSADKAEAARTIAANNIVNSIAMVMGSLLALSLSKFGIKLVDQLLLSAAMCLVSAWLALLLHRAVEGAAKADSAA